MKSVYKLFLFGVLMVFLGVLVVAGVIFHFASDLPEISKLADYNPPVPSRILSKDGQVLLEVGYEKREMVDLKSIPKGVVNAFLAAEDDKFFEHKGVDFFGMFRAAMVNLKAGRMVQGGSTITQQVAKSLLLTKEKSLSRKVKDFLLALEIEKKFTKDEILYLYLNQVYFGGGYYGVKAAFKGYFDKELKDVTVAEASMLAGLLVAPGKYSPYVNSQAAKKRQRYVLSRMHETGKINKQEYETALNQNLKFFVRRDSGMKAGYFTDWVRQRVIDSVGEESFLQDGFTVVTTLDWKLQEAAEKYVAEGVRALDKRQGFRGPLKSLKDDDAILGLLKESRKKIAKEQSTFFYVNSEGKSTFEFEFAQDQEIDPNVLNINHDVPSASEMGKNEFDNFKSLFKNGETYEAVVTHVSDAQKMVYVSIGGVKGVIPHSAFSWAHPKKVSEHTSYIYSIDKPSKILKRGDVVQVTLQDVNVAPFAQLDKDVKNKIKDPQTLDRLKNDKYFLCQLDQTPVVQSGLVSMKADTGEILAMVGGADFSRSQFNRALQANRQPGSSFKPFIFAAALEQGRTPSDILLDTPQALAGVDEGLSWKPSNYDGKFEGPVTIRRSLEESRNIPTIKLAESIGVGSILTFLNRIHFNAKISRDLSMSLGTFGVTLLDIVTSYTMFPNAGKKATPKYIVSVTDKNGQIYSIKDIEKTGKKGSEEKGKIADSSKTETAEAAPVVTNPFQQNLNDVQVYDPRLAYVMTNLLKGVVQYGTGADARSLGNNIAGKTGTTNNYVDAWFIGFSPAVVTGVWSGFDDNTTLGFGETGARTSLPTWKKFMEVAIKKYPAGDFPEPAGIVRVSINKETGRPSSSGKTFVETYAQGTEPGAAEPLKGLNAGEAAVKSKGTINEDDDYYKHQ